MKHKMYFSILVIIFLNISCNNANGQKNDLEKANLKGSVMSTTENTYYVTEKFGEIVKGEIILDDVIFNKANNITKYKLNGYMIESNGFIPTKFTYNDKNQIIEENNFTSNTKLLHKYDSTGLEIEMNNFHMDTLVQKKKFKYDIKGNEIEYNSYDYNGKLSFKIKNKFDGKKIIESKWLNNDGTLSSTNKYKYDKNGNIIEDITIDSNNKVTNKYNSTYDKNNNLIEYRMFIDNDIRNELTIYKYSYSKFDSNKNWTEQIEYENDIPTKIKERTIEYY